MVRVLMCALVLGLAATSGSTAAQERRQGGPPPYNLASEKTISATVVGLDSTEPVEGRQVTFLAVTVGGAPLKVFLGPPEWMKKQNFAFTKGATAEITGVGGYRLNGDAIMPRKITIGNRTLTLRDDTGKPLWEDAR